MFNSGYEVDNALFKICVMSEHNPTIIKDKHGRIQALVYGENNQIHRPVQNGPALVHFYPSGAVKYLAFYENGKLHRPPNSYDDIFDENEANFGAAATLWSEEGIVKYRGNYINGKLNDMKLDDGEIIPAELSYYDDGKPRCANYYTNGIKTNSEGPSTIQWYPNGNYKYLEYRLNGVLDNIRFHPARIKFYPDGIIRSQEYWSLGRYLNVIKYISPEKENEYKKTLLLC